MTRIFTAAAIALFALAAHAFPFMPLGATTPLAVTASAQTLALPTATVSLPSQVASLPDFGLQQYRVIVTGTQIVYCRSDGVTPTTSNATPYPPNAPEAISLSKTTTSISCIAAGTGSTISVTPGVGE
jgi:hypothetical protein